MTIISGFDGMTEGQAIRNLNFWTVAELNSQLRSCRRLMNRNKSGIEFGYAKFMEFCILHVLENRRRK